MPIEQLEVSDPVIGKRLSYGEADEMNIEALGGNRLSRYRAGPACDVLRSYLPAATLTNVGIFGVGQAFEYLMSKFYSHALTKRRAG